MIPRPDRLLGQVVEVHAKAGQIFRRGGHTAARGEAIFSAGRVASQQGVTVREVMVHAKRALVLSVAFGAHVEIIVRIRIAPHHHHVRLRQIFQ